MWLFSVEVGDREACSPELFIFYYNTMRCYNPGNHNLNSHRHENTKTYVSKMSAERGKSVMGPLSRFVNTRYIQEGYGCYSFCKCCWELAMCHL
jgi:hypothetical protein